MMNKTVFISLLCMLAISYLVLAKKAQRRSPTNKITRQDVKNACECPQKYPKIFQVYQSNSQPNLFLCCCKKSLNKEKFFELTYAENKFKRRQIKFNNESEKTKILQKDYGRYDS